MNKDLKREMVIKAINHLRSKHKGNIKYRVYAQDVVCELNKAYNNRYFNEFYQNIRCSTKQVKEIMEELL